MERNFKQELTELIDAIQAHPEQHKDFRVLMVIATPGTDENGNPTLEGDLSTVGSVQDIAIMADMMVDGLVSPEVHGNEELRNMVTGVISARILESSAFVKAMEDMQSEEE